MKKLSLLVIIVLSASVIVPAQETPATAEQVMSSALNIAKRDNKQVFLMFHASWCGWCKKMDASMNDESCRDFFEKNFVSIHLVVSESKDKKHLENPGGEEMKNSYGGQGSGIPFWLIFNANGDLVADSRYKPAGSDPSKPAQNIGCPATDEEVASFIEKLKLAVTLTDAETEAITARVKQNRN